jgi:hypothetical protein
MFRNGSVHCNGYKRVRDAFFGRQLFSRAPETENTQLPPHHMRAPRRAHGKLLFARRRRHWLPMRATRLLALHWPYKGTTSLFAAMGCLPSSVSRDAEPDEGERMTTEASTDRSSSSHWQRPAAVRRRRLFSGSHRAFNGDGCAQKKTPKTEADRMSLLDALSEGTLLGALASQELNELIDYMEVVVMQQGQKCDLGGCLCVVLEGEVERSSGTHSNDESGGVSQKHIAGAVFGQVGLFDNSG